MSRFKDSIVNNIPVHKWIVFVFDTIIAVAALALAGYLVKRLSINTGSLKTSYQLLLAAVTYAIFFYFFKTGNAIPKRADFKYVLRSLDAISGSFIALMLLNLFFKMTGKPPLISNIVLILSTVASIFMIGGYRFIAVLLLGQIADNGSDKPSGTAVATLLDVNNDYQRHSNPVLQIIKAKRILITGAAGSIGSGLAHQITALNHAQLILCDQSENGLYELEYALTSRYPAAAKPVIFIGDVRDQAVMENLFLKYKPQVIFHAAAYKHVPMMEAHPSEAIRNNVYGTKVMADLALKYNAERFLLVSTDKAINPTNVMGASKRIAEMYVQAVAGTQNGGQVMDDKNGKAIPQTKFITTRFGNVAGSNGSVIPRFKEQIAAGGPVTVTHPDITRYFMTLPEACALVLEAVAIGNGSEIYMFDMGEPVKISDLANKMIIQAGLKPEVDIKIKYIGLRPGEKLYEELLNKDEELISKDNKKILVAKVPVYDFEIIDNAISILLQAAADNNDEAVVQQMKRIVSEYISNNSVYESLDKIDNPTVMATS